MLTEIWSDLFHQGETPRAPIRLNPGLNIVLGSVDAANSVGKSSLLSMINFAFAGQSWPSSRVAELYGRHTVGFCFTFEGIAEHYVRIADPDDIQAAALVYPCDPDYTHPQTPIRIAEFREQLRNHYDITNDGLTFRDLVGPYVRIAGRDNLNPSRVFQQSASDSPMDATLRLQKTFGLYEQVKATDASYRNAKSRADTLRKAQKGAGLRRQRQPGRPRCQRCEHHQTPRGT